jgi:hypothetical protein
MSNAPATGAAAPFADSAFLPPPATKSDLEAVLNPIRPETLSRYLTQVERFHVFAPYEGQNEALKAKYTGSQGGPLQGGEVAPVEMGPEDLFGAPVAEGAQWLYLASVRSVDAEAIRLRVDLSLLAEDAEVWVIDPIVPRAFGPCRAADAPDGEQWLATVFGEEAVLMVRSSSKEWPGVRLKSFSHIFLSFKEIAKELSCNLDIACETDSEILSAASGTGIILVGGEWFCSGMLVNNAQTAELEPFFLTANHCVCTGTQAKDTEVYWDYRDSTCDADDAPDMKTLPRSDGDALLATTPDLDITLIRLKSVPNGAYGRTYAGWDTRALRTGDNVRCIHYPDATRMRISKGTVRAVDQNEGAREKQTEVHWDEGVTESGSSGGCLLFADNNRIVGTLSQGPTHSCGTDRSGNLDWFSSFRDFYPAVTKYIDSAAPASEPGPDDCQSQKSLCPFCITFADQPARLENFRVIRDKLLARGPLGRDAVKAYYAAAPRLAQAVSESPGLRALFKAAVSPLAQIGAWLDHR